MLNEFLKNPEYFLPKTKGNPMSRNLSDPHQCTSPLRHWALPILPSKQDQFASQKTNRKHNPKDQHPDQSKRNTNHSFYPFIKP